jgi:hypothetical protein
MLFDVMCYFTPSTRFAALLAAQHHIFSLLKAHNYIHLHTIFQLSNCFFIHSSLQIMSTSTCNNASMSNGLLLLLRAAEAADEANNSTASFLTPPRAISVASMASHVPRKPVKRYAPANVKSQSSAMPPKKRWKQSSPERILSESYPLVRTSPKQVRRVTCKQPQNHLVWENADRCRQAMAAASRFHPAFQSAGNQETKATKEARPNYLHELRSTYFHVLDELKQKMEF